MRNLKKVSGGIYLVLDPAMELNLLLTKLREALVAGVAVVQIWNNWPTIANQDKYIEAICGMAHYHNVPVLINECWEKIPESSLDGVHFDVIPSNIEAIRAKIGKPFTIGITCGNDLDKVNWAIENAVDYISFCAMFPSRSAGACEIVDLEVVKQVRHMTDMPIFLSGGITTENIHELKAANCDGVAVISGILSAENPREETNKYFEAINQIRRTI